VVLYENDHFFNSKQFNSQLDTKRRVISASLTDKSLLDNVEFAIRPEVSERKLIMITLHIAASLNHSCYQSIKLLHMNYNCNVSLLLSQNKPRLGYGDQE